MHDWLGKNNRGLAIVRVSSRRQEGNISHETQEAEIRAYCSRAGIRLEAVVRIVESARSSEDRKRYRDAINQALTQDIRHVLFYMYDRESRNLTDNERNEQLVLADVVVLHYVRDGKVLHRDSPDSDFFIRDVQAAASKQFLRNLRAKVMDSMRQKAESGWYPSNKPPLGYALQRPKDERGREMRRGAIIVRDPDEQKVKQVIREFELRAMGLTIEGVRNRIIDEGYLPRERVGQYRANAIEDRIKNPFYEGMFRWQGKLYPGKHERIVPQSLIEAARAMERGRVLKKRDPDTYGHDALAGGAWLKCVCGCSMSYEPIRKTYRSGKRVVFHYYRCSNGRKSHPSRLYIPEHVLWAEFDKVIDSIEIPADLAAKIATALNETERNHVAQARQKAERLRARSKDIERMEDRLYQDLRASVIDMDIYRRQQEQLRAERALVNAEMDRYQSVTVTNLRETAQSIVELCKDARSLFNSRSPLEKRVFLEKIVSNPTIEHVTLRFELKKPFGTLSRMAQNGEWRAQLDQFLTEVAVLQGGYVLGEMEQF